VTKRTAQVVASRDEAVERMRAALVKHLSDLYDTATIERRANEMADDLIRKGQVVVA
jgi:hypothetical protein